MLQDYLPGAVVLPAIGNHESVPVDQFPPRSVNGITGCMFMAAAAG